MKKHVKIIVCIISVVIAIAVLFTTVSVYTFVDTFVYPVVSDEYGLRSISVSSVPFVGFSIKFKCIDIPIYRVFYMQQSDKIYEGERVFDLDDKMYEKRIGVILGDCDITEKVAEKYEPYTVYDLNVVGRKVQLLWGYKDHGLHFVIASDKPIYISEEKQVKVSYAPVTVKINVWFFDTESITK